jgi:Dyp-type peroxidase family
MPSDVAGAGNPALELDDIQSGVLWPRPTPYAARYIGLRIENPAAGRQLMPRLAAVVTSAASRTSPLTDTWVTVALTYRGLETLGVPRESLESLPWEFRRGMVANANSLGDTGESNPAQWEKPLGTGAIHVLLAAVSPDTARLEEVLEPARKRYVELGPGIAAIWRQDCHSLATEKEPFGFRDGVSHPAIAGSGIAAFHREPPLKAGEFVVGYEDELDAVQKTHPEVLGRNGTYVAVRKLHQRVAAFRRYLKENAASGDEEEMLAAKMMGRWRSGAPLALCPMHDDPELGADPRRRNDFLYQQDDPLGLKTPTGSHIRRANPRDAAVAGLPRIHRMIRRGTVYGPPLADGLLEDDGQDRGLMFAFLGAHLGRQFEFVQSEWMNSGVFFGAGAARDPIAGSADGEGDFTLPRRPVRRRLVGLPRFVVTRGGEYAFIPGLRALRWLADPR